MSKGWRVAVRLNRTGIESIQCIMLMLASITGCRSDRSLNPGQALHAAVLDTLVTIQHNGLHRVGSVRLTPDYVAVANEGTLQVLLFERESEAVQVIGGRGRGPGEHQALTDIFLRGDSLYILDALARRIVLFIDGELAETWFIRGALGIPQRVFVRDAGQIAVAFADAASDEPRAGAVVVRDRIIFRVGRPLASEIEWTDLLDVPGRERLLMNTIGGTLHALPAFWTTTSYDIDRGGITAVDGRTGLLERWTWSGAVEPLPAPPRFGPDYVTDQEMAAVRDGIETVARRRPDIEYRQYAEAALDVWGARPPRPFYEGLMSDGRTIALREYEYGETNPEAWILLGSAGQLRARMLLPDNLRLVSLAGDSIIAVARDSLDVESIIVMRFEVAVDSVLAAAVQPTFAIPK